MSITQLQLYIDASEDTDILDLESLTLQLRQHLVKLDVETVDLVASADSPPGAKGGDVVTWGQLIIGLVASGGALTTLIGALQAWLTRNERRTIKIEIQGDRLELTGMSVEENARLVESWIKRHS